MTRKLFFALLVISLAVNVKYLTNKLFYKPPPINTDAWNTSRVSVHSILQVDSSDVVFVGTSLTEGFLVSEMFHSLHVKNRGVGGNNSAQILARIGDIAEGKPKKMFLEIGINDIQEAIPDDSVMRNYGRILDTIKSRSGRTELFIQSVFPAGMSRVDLNSRVVELNHKIEALAKSRNATYVDLYPSMLRGGGLDSAYTVDGIHLTGKGYLIWKRAIDSLLQITPPSAPQPAQ